jgi:3',5'-cyclic AMP phosphodiesterase CpdA
MGSPVKIEFPKFSQFRGPLYWLRDHNLWAGRRRLRADDSNNWRYNFEREYRNRAPALSAYPAPPGTSPAVGATGTAGAQVDPGARVTFLETLLGTSGNLGAGVRFLILGDTGEGDRSQYGLLPVIRAIEPDFIIINGDIAYPAGEMKDFDEGFFEPYRDLQVPVWAVPGNHEYYSDDHGATFYEIFCTRLHEDRWQRFGLRSIPQPGTYWELRDSRRGPGRLVILGVDSGQEGNLDGRISTPRTFGALFDKSVVQAAGDRRQYDWLENRLDAADSEGARAIICFHIPSLVDGQHKDDIGLVRLHQMIAMHPSVRLVVTAHVHSYQQYSPATFGKYLAGAIGRSTTNPPHYIVCGNGGAGLSKTDFKDRDYPTSNRFPDQTQWGQFVKDAKLKLSRFTAREGVLGYLAKIFDKGLGSDADEPRYLSMVLVETGPTAGSGVNPRPVGTGPQPLPGEIRVTPVWVTDLEALVNGAAPTFVPGGPVLRVDDPKHRLSPASLESCLMRSNSFVL